MSHLAVASRDLYVNGQGRERRTDGLFNHLGQMAIGGGAIAPIYQSFVRGQTDTASTYALVVQNRSQTKSNLYVRDDGLVVVEKLQVQGGIQPLLGQYYAQLSNAIPGPSAWWESPAQVNVTPTGGVVRVEASGQVVGGNAGMIIHVALGIDGALNPGVSPIGLSPAVAGQLLHYAFTWYYASPVLSAVAHRISLYFWQNASSGAPQLWPNTYTILNVTEQRA